MEETPLNVNGIRKLNGKEAYLLWNKIYSYECGYYNTWVEECKRNREFYYGEQSTAEEKKQIADRGQYEIVINKIRKSMRGIVGMVAAAVPQYKLVPLTDNDYASAAIGEKIIKWAWANSRGVNIMRLFAKNAAVDNISYFYVYVDNMLQVKFKTLAFNEVIPDPSSTDPLFRDAESLMVRRDVSVNYVREYYGLSESLVSDAQLISTGSSNPGGIDTVVGSSGIPMSQFLQRVISPDRQFVRVYEIFSKKYNRNENGTVSVRIVKDTVLGLAHVFSEELDPRITEYPIIPGYVDKAENPYARGEVHFLKELQRFINKSFGVALLNAQLLSNPKVFITETDIPSNDTEALQKSFAIPGKINVLAAGAMPPVIVQGQPLNQAFFTMYQDAKLEMEWNTIPNQMLGMVDSEKTGFAPSAVLDMKQTVLDSFKDFMSNIELSCTQLGVVVLQFSRAYLPEGTIIRIAGEDDLILKNEETVKVDFSDEQQVNAHIARRKQQGFPDERIEEELAEMKYADGKIKAIRYFKEALDFEKYDVTIIPGSYTPTYEMGMLRLMMELMQVGAVDPTIVLKYLPVDNREELIERFDKIKMLTSMLEQADGEKQELEKLVNSLTGQVIKGKIDVAVKDGEVKTEKEVAMQRIKSYFDKRNFKAFTEEAKHAMFRDISKILDEVELEAEKEKIKIRSGGNASTDFGQAIESAFGVEESS